MRTRFFRPVATVLSLLLLVAVPAQASPINFADVVNVIGNLQSGNQVEQLRLRAVIQDPSTPAGTATKSLTPTAPSADGDVAPTSPSLVSGTEVAPQQPQGDVQVFEQDQVDGTICDCGEIPAVGGGFPKWPFLALIPLICVTGICHHERVPPPPEVPTPTPPPPIPEPATLLLFGSGIVALSAGARRRYARMRASKQAAAMTEV